MTVASVSTLNDPGTAAILSRGTTTPRVTDSTPAVTNKEVAPRKMAQSQQKETAPDQQEKVFDIEKIQQAADQIEAAAAAVDVNLQFRVDPLTQIVQMVITDPETNEVVMEIPPEDVLKAASSLKDIIGLLIDTTA